MVWLWARSLMGLALSRPLVGWSVGRSVPAQFFEAQPGLAGHLLEPGDGLELVAGHRLLGQAEELRHVLVGPPLDDQELEAAESVVIAAGQPLAHELPEGLAEQPLLGLAAL